MKQYSQFPLYRDDGKSLDRLSDQQQRGIRALKQAVADRSLVLEENHCLCGKADAEGDIVVSEKDRYGFPVPQLLCSKCGLIRGGVVFDEASNNRFYQNYYRDIYSTHTPTQRFFDDQIATGRRFMRLLQQHVPLKEVHRVAEVGCGAGGILVPFFEAGKQVDGYDYGEEYLNYGRSKGLTLHAGDFYQIAEDESVDLVILSHVLEHFLDPVSELRRILRKVRPSGFLLVEVPGIFHIHISYVEILDYFQNAHVYDFTRDHLTALFHSLGLDVVYGDEICTFICRKREEGGPEPARWPDLSDKVAGYLLETRRKRWKWKCYCHVRTLRRIGGNIVHRLGWK